MRKVLLLISFLCCASLIINAQQNLSNNNPTLAFAKSKETNHSIFNNEITANNSLRRVKTAEHWRKLRNNGIVLTSLGAACITAGALLVNADVYDVDGIADGTRAVFGIMGIAGGIMSVGGGVTMWAIGNNRLRKIQDVSLRASGNAVGFVYKF